MRVRGRGLPDGSEIDLWIDHGVLSVEPIAGADFVHDGGWILPGLVDAHCHVGIEYGGGHTDPAGSIAQAETERSVGALLLRDAGSPVDTRELDERDDLPRIIRAGPHIASGRPGCDRKILIRVILTVRLGVIVDQRRNVVESFEVRF